MTPGLPCLVKGNRLSLAPAMPRPTVNPAFVKAVTANSRLCATGCGLVYVSDQNPLLSRLAETR